jgi:hypothetical protein
MRLYPISGRFLILVPFHILIKQRFTTLIQKPTISISYQTLVKKFSLQEQIKCKSGKESDQGKEEWKNRGKEAGSKRKQSREGKRKKVMGPNNYYPRSMFLKYNTDY